MGSVLDISGSVGLDGQVEAGPLSLGEPLLNVAQAASLLNVRESWVRTAARTGQLPCVRVGRHLRFSREQLEHWLGEQCATTPITRRPAGLADARAGRARSGRVQ
jgi:excisionase family DNA binding protein